LSSSLSTSTGVPSSPLSQPNTPLQFPVPQQLPISFSDTPLSFEPNVSSTSQSNY
jgi:hypothetical protein